MQSGAWKAIVIAVVIVAFGGRSAPAGTTQYEWAPMAGSGTYAPFGGFPVSSYESFGGYLIINYDPNNVQNDSVVAYVGDPINQSFEISPAPLETFNVTFDRNTLIFFGQIYTAEMRVSLTGDPGPLSPLGLPDSLDGFLDQWADVRVAVSNNTGYGLSFIGVAGTGAPEPSSLLMLALGLGGITLAHTVRAKRRARLQAQGEQPLSRAERRPQS